jgi:lipid A 4'-phosphatase
VRVGSFVLGIAIVLAGLVFFPSIDLWVSGQFATADRGFFYQGAVPLVALNRVAFHGARVMAVLFAVGGLWAMGRRQPVGGLSAKAWWFLLVALLVGPGLVANVIFKDHWGRARPREITAFAGKARFTPAFVLSDQCATNCSFVSGDGAFGFFLPTVAYVVPWPRRRRAFWSLLACGAVFAGARIVAGAHFFSDVVFAAFFVFLSSALLHALFFGAQETAACWRVWGRGRKG